MHCANAGQLYHFTHNAFVELLSLGTKVFFLMNKFSMSSEVIQGHLGSNKIRKAYLDGIWWREGGGVFFMMNIFSRSSEVIQGHRGSNKIRKAYLDGIWWREGGWGVLFDEYILKVIGGHSRPSGVK